MRILLNKAWINNKIDFRHVSLVGGRAPTIRNKRESNK